VAPRVLFYKKELVVGPCVLIPSKDLLGTCIEKQFN